VVYIIISFPVAQYALCVRWRGRNKVFWELLISPPIGSDTVQGVLRSEVRILTSLARIFGNCNYLQLPLLLFHERFFKKFAPFVPFVAGLVLTEIMDQSLMPQSLRRPRLRKSLFGCKTCRSRKVKVKSTP
jgi:hypothetical protein